MDKDYLVGHRQGVHLPWQHFLPPCLFLFYFIAMIVVLVFTEQNDRGGISNARIYVYIPGFSMVGRGPARTN